MDDNDPLVIETDSVGMYTFSFLLSLCSTLPNDPVIYST